MVVYEQGGVWLGFNKPDGQQEGGHSAVPCARGLFQTIEGLLQEVDKVRVSWIFKPGRLLAIHSLGQGAVQKGVLHVKLVHGPAAGERQGEHCADGSRLHHGRSVA
jgi:hypothetical protein